MWRRRRSQAAGEPLNYNVKLALWWALWENCSSSVRSGDVLSALLFLLTGSNTTVGLVQGLNGIAQLVAALPAGYLADRHRRDTLLRAGALVGAAAGGLLAAALAWRPTVPMLAAASALLGCYSGTYNAALEALFADSVPPGRSSPYSRKYAVTVLASSFGPWLSLLLFHRLGNKWDAADCRAVLLCGVALMVVPLSLMLCFDDDRALKHHGQPSLAVAGGQGQQQGQQQRTGSSGSDGSSAGVVVTLLITGSDLIGALASGMTLKFFALFFIQVVGLSPMAVSLVGALAPLGVSAAALACQPLSKPLGRVQISLITRSLDIALLVLLAFLPTAPPSVRPLLVAVHLARMAVANATRPLMRSVLMDWVPRRLRGRVNAVDSVRSFSWSGSAALGGFLIQRYGFQTTFLITAAIKAAAFAPLIVLLAYVPDGVCLPAGARAARLQRQQHAVIGVRSVAVTNSLSSNIVSKAARSEKRLLREPTREAVEDCRMSDDDADRHGSEALVALLLRANATSEEAAADAEQPAAVADAGVPAAATQQAEQPAAVADAGVPVAETQKAEQPAAVADAGVPAAETRALEAALSKSVAANAIANVRAAVAEAEAAQLAAELHALRQAVAAQQAAPAVVQPAAAAPAGGAAQLIQAVSHQVQPGSQLIPGGGQLPDPGMAPAAAAAAAGVLPMQSGSAAAAAAAGGSRPRDEEGQDAPAAKRQRQEQSSSAGPLSAAEGLMRLGEAPLVDLEYERLREQAFDIGELQQLDTRWCTPGERRTENVIETRQGGTVINERVVPTGPALPSVGLSEAALAHVEGLRQRCRAGEQAAAVELLFVLRVVGHWTAKVQHREQMPDVLVRLGRPPGWQPPAPPSFTGVEVASQADADEPSVALTDQAAKACVILSGGLDSSIAACAGRDILGLSAAFTVLCTPAATDRQYAAQVAAALPGVEHHVIDISLEEALQELPDCVRVLQSFDPMTLRNDIAVCRALREAAARGFTCAVTGDAADELFGGYNFTHRLDEAAWEHNRQRMAALMSFGSVPLGQHFGLFVTSPFTQPAVVQAAMWFNKADCVQPRPAAGESSSSGASGASGAGASAVAAPNGSGGGSTPEQQEQQQPLPLLGKMPLRLAFPKVPTCWRGKDPIEVGCGTTELGDRAWLPGAPAGYFSARTSDEEFAAGQAAAAAEGVTIRDKEHLHYWLEFRRQFAGGEVPGKPRHGSDPCPACGYQLSSPEQTFCVTNRWVSLVPRGPYTPPPANASTPAVFLYAWSGNDNPGPNCKDALVVVDATPESPTFGQILNVAFTPTWGNEPHHVGLTANTSILGAGGFNSYLAGNPDIHLFNISVADKPRWVASADPPKSAVTDSFLGQADGGFFISQMGGADGGTPGRIVRLGPAPNFPVVGEYPANPPPGFNPHGIAIDATRQKLVTAEYLDYRSTLNGRSVPTQFRGSGKTLYRHSLRVWNLPDFSLASEFITADSETKGFMTAQFLGSTGIAVSGGGNGVVWAINVSAPNPAATAKPAHFIAGEGRTESCVFTVLGFSSGRRVVTTVLGLSLVQLVDTSNPFRWRVIQEIYLPAGTYPHAVTATRNGTLLAVSTYYVDQKYNGKRIGVIDLPGSREIYFFDVLDDGNRIAFSRRLPRVDFKTEVNRFLNNWQCGTWRPHGLAFKTIAPKPLPPTGFYFFVNSNNSIVAAGNVSRLDISCNINRPVNSIGQRCLTPAARENFGTQFQALLRIPRYGKAQFKLTYSGFARVWTNREAQSAGPVAAGKCKASGGIKTGGGNSSGGGARLQTRVSETDVQPGQLPIIIEWNQGKGSSTLRLQWRAPGSRVWEELPVAVPPAPFGTTPGRWVPLS
ncbi:MFS general substrate transporter [Chlorella sorokiniana]|uniref:MFS general substrate transporter n=1 Tax=Chlorella sorokiniana TaxID=3076 RepID=A0A2P6TX10_CHLSO|nr:MFS general substrate transporter [Chlorella sorokiniana]|eukprot:PRW58602.1 MFS general substrate transporter [Chlorella sorokiniana]